MGAVSTYRRAVGAGKLFPFSTQNLVQCSDVLLSANTLSAGRVTRIADLSGLGHDLVLDTNSSGPTRALGSDGVPYWLFAGSGTGLVAQYGQAYGAYTMALLFTVVPPTSNYTTPYFASGAGNESSFLYMENGNLKSHTGNGYGNYEYVDPAGYCLVVLSHDPTSGFSAIYQTGLNQNAPGENTQFTGNNTLANCFIGRDCGIKLYSHQFYGRAMSYTEMAELVSIQRRRFATYF